MKFVGKREGNLSRVNRPPYANTWAAVSARGSKKELLAYNPICYVDTPGGKPNQIAKLFVCL